MNVRPKPISILAVINFIAGVIFLFVGAAIFVGSVAFMQGGTEQNVGTRAMVSAVGLLLLVNGIVSLASGWGLWKLLNWARWLAIIAYGLGIAINVVYLFARDPSTSELLSSIVGIAISFLIVYYLLMPQTAAHFSSGSSTYAGGSTISGTSAGQSVEFTATAQSFESISLYTPPPAEVPQNRTRVAEPHTPAMAWLIVKTGPTAGERVDIGADIVIGRDSTCDVRLDHDDYVSRQHARIKVEDGRWFIHDLGSSGGTTVNSREVRRYMLNDGNIIRVGRTDLEFKRLSPNRLTG